MSRLERLKISKGIVEAVVIGIVVFASSFLAIKASEDLLLDSVSDGVMSALFGQFQNGNQLIFDLSVGVLVSVLIYVAVVRIPELRKRRRAKAHLERTYRDFKKEVIRVMVAAQGSSYEAGLPESLLDKVRFREYFKEKPLPSQNRWDIAFNNFDDYGLRQLRDEFEILIEELRFTFLAIDVDDEDAFGALKRLQQISHRMKGSTLEYEDKKSLFRFLWSICSGFSFITGYREPDYIEKIISSV